MIGDATAGAALAWDCLRLFIFGYCSMMTVSVRVKIGVVGGVEGFIVGSDAGQQTTFVGSRETSAFIVEVTLA